MDMASQVKKASWGLEEGAPIADGRSVVEKLGGGRRYEVYLVWDERLYSLAVAKVLRPDRVERDGSVRALRREAELLERLAHPVVVRGFGAVLEGDYPHVLIEYLDGVMLRQLISRHGRLPLEQLLPLAQQILSALHYLSTEGVVHLDVKPGNIVMGVPPRLIDLSLARPVESAAQLQKAVGTWSYMAPEQCDPLSHPGTVGPPTDVWGLGATLHHAISGEFPFARAADAAASNDLRVRCPQLVEEPVPLPKDVPALLQDLIAQMLARDPGQRPSPGEVADALEPLAVHT
jgi:eukaryotic-like serine/threonine-protein kinase